MKHTTHESVRFYLLAPRCVTCLSLSPCVWLEGAKFCKNASTSALLESLLAGAQGKANCVCLRNRSGELKFSPRRELLLLKSSSLLFVATALKFYEEQLRSCELPGCGSN